MNLYDTYDLDSRTIAINYGGKTKIYRSVKGGLKKLYCNNDAYAVLSLLLKGLSPYTIANMMETTDKQQHILQFIEMLNDNKIIVSREPLDSNFQIRKIDDNITNILSRIFLCITNACNLKCKHCYNERVQQPQFMSLELIHSILEQGYKLGLKQIDITGGECFLHPDILEILNLVSNFGMLINVYTNGTLLNSEIIKKLENFRIMNLIVSLESLNPKTHDSFRGINGSHKKTMETLKLIKDSSLNLRINITAMEDNENEMDNMIDYIYNELLAESIVIAPILQTGNGMKSFCLNTNMQKICGYQKKIYRVLEQRIQTSKPGSRYKAHCGVGNSMLYIDTDGTVCLCPTLTQYEKMEFALGNLKSIRLIDAFLSMHNNGFATKLLCKDVENCNYADSCRGGCRSRAFLQNQSIDDVDDLMCHFYNSLSNEASGLPTRR